MKIKKQLLDTFKNIVYRNTLHNHTWTIFNLKSITLFSF